MQNCLKYTQILSANSLNSLAPNTVAVRMILLLLCILLHTGVLHGQSSDTLAAKPVDVKADDPSQFFTRIEVFNEVQYYDGKDYYLNQSVVRAIVKIGKRFTTRVDIPYVNNSIAAGKEYKHSGLGDISFRLLGFKFLDRPRSAFTTSIELSMNTAESRYLGTGKNILIPMITYTLLAPKVKMLFSLVVQQVNSVSGDEERRTVNFSKVQFIALKTLSRRLWVVLAPEWYLDYENKGLSMNLRTRMTYAPAPRMNIWISPSAGIFGDFVGRYQWSMDIGGRYFLFRGMDFKKN
jgi:hypothetical protein